MMSPTKTLRRNARLLCSAGAMGILGLVLLTACHTTAGFGQDMQSVGRNVENSANKNNK
jgi:predicted small secreted protein